MRYSRVANPKLTALRKARGYSGRKLAELAGISQPLLWKLEHDPKSRTPKGLKTALAIAAVLRVKVLDIWPDAAPQPRPQQRVRRKASAVADRRSETLENRGKRKR
jgi:transcriptional regulator with XRE-family HTH domain